MLGFGAIGEFPLGTGPNTPPVLATGDQPVYLTALRAFLLTILPTGVEVILGQVNRVAEPKSAQFLVLTPIRRERIATNVDQYIDCKFTGSITGTQLTVTQMFWGQIDVSAPLSGVGILPNTTIVSFGTGGGGIGTYTIAPAQNVASRILSTGVANLIQNAIVTVQIDLHGTVMGALGDLVGLVTTAFRDDYAVSWFAQYYPGVVPIEADDGRQVPFINAEQQYENRWVLEARLEINPTIVLPQQFADQLNITAIPADVILPL